MLGKGCRIEKYMISFNFDKEAEAFYLEIKQGEFSKDKKLSNSVILDLDKNEDFLGLEIINVSKLGGFSPLLESQIETANLKDKAMKYQS